MHCQRFYIQVMIVRENNPQEYVLSEKGTAVEIINALDSLFMRSVVAQQIAFSEPTAISEGVSQHLVLVIYATLTKLAEEKHFVYIVMPCQHLGHALSFYLLTKIH